MYELYLELKEQCCEMYIHHLIFIFSYLSSSSPFTVYMAQLLIKAVFYFEHISVFIH